MTFDERFGNPRDGHELTTLDDAGGVAWCIRCGALRLEARHGVRPASWEAPSQSGRSLSTVHAPACLPSTGMGAGNESGDMRLMLHALTHGWSCKPILLAEGRHAEAWRWSRQGALGGETWAVPGAWRDGPVMSDEVRRLLLTTTA